MNGTIWFLDPQNIALDTKIIILCALVQKLWQKMRFRKMVENITYPEMTVIQNTRDFITSK